MLAVCANNGIYRAEGCISSDIDQGIAQVGGAGQFAAELRHRLVYSDAPHNRSFARLIQTALFQVEQHLEFFYFHTLIIFVGFADGKVTGYISVLCYAKTCKSARRSPIRLILFIPCYLSVFR